MSKKVKRKLNLSGQKGTLSDKTLKVLSQAGDEIVVKLFENEELTGIIKGIGQYSLLLNRRDQGDILIFKHSVKYIELFNENEGT